MSARKAQPAVLDALCREGFELHRAGRLDEARNRYQKVILRDPKHVNALQLLGALYVQTGRLDEAASLLSRAIRLNPNAASAHVNLGKALVDLGRPLEALSSYDRALDLEPRNAEAWHKRAVALLVLGRLEAAVADGDRAIALAPGLAEAHVNRGIALLRLERLAEAVAACDQAIALDPHIAEPHINRGVALQRLGRTDEALQSCDRGAAFNPESASAHFSRGPILSDLARPDEALATYERAIALQPDHFDAQVNRSLSLLQLGRLGEGWSAYEWRKREWAEDKRQPAGAGPLWLGEPIPPGKRLLVPFEQGFGDTLQFCRYARLLQDQGVDFVLSVQRPLKSLVRTLGPAVSVIAEDETAPRCDFHCHMLSLPLAFGTTLETIPAPPRYLRSDEARQAPLAARLGDKARPRIGLAWSGSPSHVNDHNRSIAFERLQPLLSKDVQWVCLQDEIRPSDEAAFRDCGRVAFLGAELEDFAAAAALVDLMDLVITVDTSIAHLAGALGKPVWILLPFNPDWRWLLGRDDSPWYPGARLFRQPRFGDWAGVIEAVRGALGAIAG